MVSIRLMDDEYRQLKALCEARGARSVSDLARAALFGLLPEPGAAPGAALAEEVRRLDRLVRELGEQMRSIEDRLETRAEGRRWAG